MQITRKKILLYFIYVNFINPMPPRTEIDKGSQIHDRDGARWARSQSMQADNKWMRHASSLWVGGGILGPIPTRKMINNTWERESHYLHKKHTFWGKPRGVYGDATNLVTNIKFGMQIMQEYKATLYGYALFGTANAVNQNMMFNGDLAHRISGKTPKIKLPSMIKPAFKIRVRL